MGPRSRREESRRRTGDPITHCSHSGQIGSRTGGDAPFPTWRQVSQWSGGCRAPRSGALLPEGQGCLTRDFACLEHHCYRSLGVTALKILAAFASGFLIFPALCWFLPYGNVTQPSLHICPLAHEPPSPLPIPFPLGHHRAPGLAPCLINMQQLDTSDLSDSAVCVCRRSCLHLPHSLPPPLCPQGVLYICVPTPSPNRFIRAIFLNPIQLQFSC